MLWIAGILPGFKLRTREKASPRLAPCGVGLLSVCPHLLGTFRHTVGPNCRVDDEVRLVHRGVLTDRVVLTALWEDSLTRCQEPQKCLSRLIQQFCCWESTLRAESPENQLLPLDTKVLIHRSKTLELTSALL